VGETQIRVFQQQLQPTMDFLIRHPIPRRLILVSLVFYVIAGLYGALIATTLLGHAWRTFAAAVYAAVAIWVWKRSSPKTKN
jgi:hypothetical protein